MEINVAGLFQQKKYKVIIKQGLIDELDKETSDFNKAVIVTDKVIDRLFLQNCSLPKIVLDGGEQMKSFKALEEILEKMSSEHNMLRNSCLICVGGGVIGDLGGFAASIYMRGISYIHVPTSLLAMVDSSLGGKTGINLKAGKNLVGAFYNPTKILVDPIVLQNLPDSEIKNGMTEMVKHAFIADRSLVDEMYVNPLSEESIAKAMKVKIDIITEDPFEQNKRKWLNVGHTIAHALEKLSALSMPHGVAVAKGIYLESLMASKLEINHDFENTVKILDKLKLDYAIENINYNDVWTAMTHDKKNTTTGKVAFAFLKGIGMGCEVLELSKEEFFNLVSN